MLEFRELRSLDSVELQVRDWQGEKNALRNDTKDLNMVQIDWLLTGTKEKTNFVPKTGVFRISNLPITKSMYGTKVVSIFAGARLHFYCQYPWALKKQAKTGKKRVPDSTFIVSTRKRQKQANNRKLPSDFLKSNQIYINHFLTTEKWRKDAKTEKLCYNTMT